MGSSGKSGDRPVDAPDPLSPEEAAALMGMGSWRLGRHVCPAIETLVAQIEGGWRVSYPDLGLCEIPQVGSACMVHQEEEPHASMLMKDSCLAMVINQRYFYRLHFQPAEVPLYG